MSPALLATLPRLVAALPEEWSMLTEREKRLLVNALLAEVVVRVTPMPHPVPYEREVVAVRYQGWLREFTGG